MAGNAREKNYAFQSAESALRDAELWLATQTSQPLADGTGSNGVWRRNAPGGNSWWQAKNASWWAANGEAMSGLGHVSAQPMSIVEEDRFVRDSLAVGQQKSSTGMMYYRVTSRGMGGGNRAVVELQSSYARRF